MVLRTLDADRHMTEHFIPLMQKLEESWKATTDVPPRFKSNALKLLTARWKWMEFNTHRACYALSPNYHGDEVKLNRRIMLGLHKVIEFYVHNTNCTTDEVLAEFDLYKEMPMQPDLFPARSAPLDPVSMSPLTWWRLHGSEWPLLQEMSICVFNMGCTSSSAERNWSAFGNIWNKRSSGYSAENASMICSIKYNTQSIFEWRQKQRKAAIQHQSKTTAPVIMETDDEYESESD